MVYLRGLVWGWIWALVSLGLGRHLFGWECSLNLPWILAVTHGLGSRLPGGLLGVVLCSLLLDSWSLRTPGLESAVLLMARWVVQSGHRLFEVTGLWGQAVSLALALALARVLSIGFEGLLSSRWIIPSFQALLLTWMVQVGVALVLVSAIPAMDEGGLRTGR